MKDENPVNQLRIDINPESTPIYYTDNINIAMNADGIVLNFCQTTGPNQMKVISRIGMSHEHAKKFISKMGSLLMNETKIKTGSGVKN